MTFYIYIKPESEKSVEGARRACERFASLGIVCVSDESNASLLGSGVLPVNPCAADYDAVAAVGGDGTMLGASQLAILRGLPLFGINSGRVGFLCAFDAKDIESITLEDINTLRLSRRALLEVRCGETDVHYAVNEVTINKADFAKTVEFELYYGDNSLGNMRADGVIISTPTGSTGYSLSAGGPITDPSLAAMIVTPICAHSLFSRSHVLSGEYPVRIVPAERFANTMRISVDGADYSESAGDCEISVSLSSSTLSLLTNDRRDFYSVLFDNISGRS